MKKIFAMVLAAAMVMTMGVCAMAENTITKDAAKQIALEKAIREYAGTVLMVTHDLFAVTGACDRVLLIEDAGIKEMSGRAYRKSIYKNYFSSDIFEEERKIRKKQEN